VAIRADASAHIGSGHVVRCLALADGLAARGGEVTFVTRELPPHLRDAVLRSGHRHVSLALPIPGGLDAPQEPWPQDQQLLDAASTREALVAFKPEWLVVDHYGLAEHWETDMHASGVRVLAIDDLARAHSCDILLDANFHAHPGQRYRALQD